MGGGGWLLSAPCLGTWGSHVEEERGSQQPSMQLSPAKGSSASLPGWPCPHWGGPWACPPTACPLPSTGSLTECYDELGNRYQLPVYCLSPPVNLILERSEEEASEPAEPLPNARREFALKVRLSTGKDLRLSASMGDTIGQLKKQLQAQEGIDMAWQRWFFSGKLLTDRTRLQETKIQKDFVVQVIVNQPLPLRN